VAVFELNVESYPKSANTHDSLGEAYMKTGKKAKAIASYKKSLALAPQSENAKAMLKKLQK
jgi:cytochrome c-type biogenesis protein CcmH/NrfG